MVNYNGFGVNKAYKKQKKDPDDNQGLFQEFKINQVQPGVRLYLRGGFRILQVTAK